MKNFNLFGIALCVALNICIYNANGNQMLEAQAEFVNKQNVNDNIEICIPCNDDEYYKYDISKTVIDVYPILQYFTNNQAVNKQYTIDE